MIPWRRDRLPTPVFLGFPGGSAEKESACNAEDLGLMPGLGRSPGEGKGHLFQYSGLENPVDCVVFNQIVWGFPLSSAGKESVCNAGDPGLIHLCMSDPLLMTFVMGGNSRAGSLQTPGLPLAGRCFTI